MKRVFLIGCMAFLLAGCSDNPVRQESANKNASASEQTSQDVKTTPSASASSAPASPDAFLLKVKPTYRPLTATQPCDIKNSAATCAPQIADYSNRYWRFEIVGQADGTASSYDPPGFWGALFNAGLAAIYDHKQMLSVTFKAFGPGESPASEIPVVMLQKRNSEPIQDALNVRPIAISPWVSGKQTNTGDTAVAFPVMLANTYDSNIVNLAKGLVNGFATFGFISPGATVLLPPAQKFFDDLAKFEHNMENARNGSLALSTQAVKVDPKYLTEIAVYQEGFTDGSAPLLSIVVKAQDSKFVNSLADDWMQQSVLGTANTTTSRSLAEDIAALDVVKARTAKDPITKEICQQIAQIGEDAGLVPADQGMLVASWALHNGWDRELSTRDNEDSCYQFLKDTIPPQATALANKLKPKSELVRKLAESDTANVRRESEATDAAYRDFSMLMRGKGGDLWSSRLTSLVTISAVDSFPELDNYFQGKLKELGATYTAAQLADLLSGKDGNPLVYPEGRKNCFNLSVDTASKSIKLECMQLKRADGSLAKLEVILETDRNIFQGGNTARIQSIQFRAGAT